MNSYVFPSSLNGFHIHMVGIKGTGMAALAEILCARQAVLTGSDVPDVFYTDAILKKLGVSFYTSFEASHITSDINLVIHSSAYVADKNPELVEAARQGIPVILYTEALGALSAQSYSCGVAGVHGKTTTTGMVGTILKNIALPAQILAGSVIPSFGNSCTYCSPAGSKYFVAETCEYQRHFMSFKPQKIILTSVESDHQDCYPTYESILTAFMQYLDLLPDMGEVFYCADDKGACDVVRMLYASRPDLIYTPYGESASGAYKITFQGIKNGRQEFSLAGIPGLFKLRIPGHHNVLNATAAVALCVSLIEKEKGKADIKDYGHIRSSLEKYAGSRRRSEIIGEVSDMLFIDDYGHHPTAIKKTLAGIKEFYPGRRIVVDFMSHTYTRTAALLDEFAHAFDDADMLLLHKIYGSARESYTGGVTGRTLFEKASANYQNVYYFEEFSQAQDFLTSRLLPGDIFITMGAGDNWTIGANVYKYFTKKRRAELRAEKMERR